MAIPESVRLKLDRASEHLEELEGEIQKFLSSEPYAVKRVQEPNSGEIVFYWERYILPPARLGLIVGDSIHNLRSALDHLALALAETGAASAGKTLTEREMARIQFPITKSLNNFNKELKAGRLAYIAPNTQSVIEQQQPYHTSHPPHDNSVLVIVQRLDNRDKHRALNLLGTIPSVGRVNWPKPLTRGSNLQYPKYRCTEPGAELCRILIPGLYLRADIPETRIDFGIELVGFHWLEGVEGLIKNCISSIRSTTIESLGADCN